MKYKINKVKVIMTLGFILIYSLESCSQSEPDSLKQNGVFILSGDLNNVKEPVSQVKIRFKKNGVSVVDSAKVINKRFEIKNSITEAVQAYIFLIPDTIAAVKAGVSIQAKRYRLLSRVFLDKASIKIIFKEEPDKYIINGSNAHKEFEKITHQTFPLLESYSALSEVLENAKNSKKLTDDSLVSLSQKMSTLNNKTFDIHLDYSNKNPASHIAVWALSMYLGKGELDTAAVITTFSNLPPENKSSFSGKSLEEKLQNFVKNAVNKKAVPFTLLDASGKLISLAAFKGKYVLIDFWASWCVPCRAENPNLVDQYKKYKYKGFEIVGIAIEQTDAKAMWLKAIKQDNLTWTQLCDFRYWDSKVVKEYSVYAISHNVLVNPDGDIISINLKGNDLTNKLKEIFK